MRLIEDQKRLLAFGVGDKSLIASLPARSQGGHLGQCLGDLSCRFSAVEELLPAVVLLLGQLTVGQVDSQAALRRLPLVIGHPQLAAAAVALAKVRQQGLDLVCRPRFFDQVDATIELGSVNEATFATTL
jgi:hypothetical protein